MSRRSDLLVETDWLAEHLHDSDLRILECTVYLHPADVPGGYRVESGRGRWEQGHIPGAGFADLPDVPGPTCSARPSSIAARRCALPCRPPTSSPPPWAAMAWARGCGWFSTTGS